MSGPVLRTKQRIAIAAPNASSVMLPDSVMM